MRIRTRAFLKGGGGGGGENFRGMRETSMLNYYATATLEGEKESERDGNFSQYFC